MPGTSAKRTIERLIARFVPPPLDSSQIVPVPTDAELQAGRERRALDITRMQGEGSVLLSEGRLNMHRFDLFDDDPAIEGV